MNTQSLCFHAEIRSLTHMRFVSYERNTGKQCRPRSAAAVVVPDQSTSSGFFFIKLGNTITMQAPFYWKWTGTTI